MATSHTPRSTGRPACREFSADARLVTSCRVLGPQLSLQRGGREPGAAWVAPALAARRRQHADALRSPHAASLLRRLDSVAPPPQGSARTDRSGGRLGRSVARCAVAARGRGVRVPRCAVECAAPGAAFPAATAAADGTLPSLCIAPPACVHAAAGCAQAVLYGPRVFGPGDMPNAGPRKARAGAAAGACSSVLLQAAWVGFNLALCVFFGLLHQAGVGRALVDLGAASPGTAVRGGGGVFPGTPAAAATVVFFHTYMPPLALTAQAAQLAEPQVRKPPAPKLPLSGRRSKSSCCCGCWACSWRCWTSAATLPPRRSRTQCSASSAHRQPPRTPP